MSANRVMVVDDDADVRDAVCLALQLEGYDTVQARHGADALAKLQSGDSPSLILLDLMMPEMNGLEFLREYSRRAALPHRPVVVLSGDPSANAAARALGAEDSLAKPVELTELLEAVHRLSGPAVESPAEARR